MNHALRLLVGVPKLFHFLNYLSLKVLLSANLAHPGRNIGDYRQEAFTPAIIHRHPFLDYLSTTKVASVVRPWHHESPRASPILVGPALRTLGGIIHRDEEKFLWI